MIQFVASTVFCVAVHAQKDEIGNVGIPLHDRTEDVDVQSVRNAAHVARCDSDPARRHANPVQERIAEGLENVAIIGWVFWNDNDVHPTAFLGRENARTSSNHPVR